MQLHRDCSHCFEPSDATYPAAAASPLWPPSRRLLGGSCLSFWISPRQPCPRRSPCSPWLRTHDQPSTNEQKKGRAAVQMPSGCASNGGGVPVSTEAQTQPWAEFWPTWLKSHRCSSARTSKIPQNHLGFNWGLLCPRGHARRRMCRIHPCASAHVLSVLAWWRTRGDCCSCRRWRSPEFPHSPPTTVLRWADVTRKTWLDSPIKSWWDVHAVARPEPIKLEAPEAGYEVRCGAVQ